MPLGSSRRSPGMSWSAGCPSTRSHAVPAVTAWRAAPVLSGRSNPHGAPARTLASSAPCTRPRSSTSASGSTTTNRTDRALQRHSVRRTGKNQRRSVISIASAWTYGHRMDLTTSTPVVTGAARGLGRHLVDALLERGAPKVYALARDTSRVRQDPRIVPVAFDLLDADEHLGGRASRRRRHAADQQRLDGGVRRPARRRRPTPSAARWPSTTTAPTQRSAPSCRCSRPTAAGTSSTCSRC